MIEQTRNSQRVYLGSNESVYVVGVLVDTDKHVE